MKDWENKVNSAILKKFDVDSKEVPIDILSDYILKTLKRYMVFIIIKWKS